MEDGTGRRMSSTGLTRHSAKYNTKGMFFRRGSKTPLRVLKYARTTLFR